MFVCRTPLLVWHTAGRVALTRGFNSSWWNKYEEKQYEKKQEQFTKEIQSMAGKSSYTLMDFRQRIIDGLNEANKGTIRRMFGNNDQTEAQMIMQRKILNAMFEEELTDPDNLTCRCTTLTDSQRETRHLGSGTVQCPRYKHAPVSLQVDERHAEVAEREEGAWRNSARLTA